MQLVLYYFIITNYVFFLRNRNASVVDVEKCGHVIVQNCVMRSEVGNPVAVLYFGFMKLFVKLQLILINVLSTVTDSFRIIFLMWVSLRVLLTFWRQNFLLNFSTHCI
jgi:hypothetical protein